ncbi:MAG: hypothetical protein ACPG8W_01785 [Candidatus Promineifilaceae bacterium]
MASKKKFSLDSVVNPLKKSVYFTQPESPREMTQETQEVSSTVVPAPPQLVDTPPAASPVSEASPLSEPVVETKKRTRGRPKFARATSRHSFEFYTDQVNRLRRVKALRELNENRSISLSEIVRDAISSYIEAFEENSKAEEIISRTG